METRHSDYRNKDKSFFERKLESFNKTRSILEKKCRTESENLTEVSYKAVDHFSLHGEVHIIFESLVKPILKDILSCIFGEKQAQAVESISLSSDMVLRRIVDIAEDIENELISQLHVGDAYMLQMDESTDVSGLAIPFVLARHDLFFLQSNFF